MVEIARQSFSVSRAAEALNVAQPALSRHLRAFERELGVDLFLRKQKRLRGLTPPGAVILDVAQRILNDAANIAKIAHDFSDQKSGQLTVATTHTQALYALPPVIQRFSQRYPEVEVMIRQDSPTKIIDLVRRREADVCIGSESGEGSDLLLLPCHTMHRVVLTPPGHPLLTMRRLTLENLARYPIITYDAPFVGRLKLVNAFAVRGLKPKIVLSAIDTDVIKAYVERGLGVAIIAKLAFDAKRDKNLRSIDASHLFEPNTIHLGIHRDDYLRNYVFDFIEMFSPQLKKKQIKNALQTATGARKSSAKRPASDQSD